MEKIKKNYLNQFLKQLIKKITNKLNLFNLLIL